MPAAWFLESTKVEGLRFRIMKLDRATMKAVLQGDTGVPFDRDISEASLQKYGYRVVQREVPATAPEDSNV